MKDEFQHLDKIGSEVGVRRINEKSLREFWKN